MFEDLGVRIAHPSEVHDIMEMSLEACSENGFSHPNPLRLLDEVWAALNLDHGVVGVIGEPGNIEGGILLRVTNVWYSNQEMLEERAIFIRPEYRSAKGGRARRLCDFAKRSAEMLKVPLLIGVLSNHRTEAKVRMYERQFGKPTGAFFLYNAKTGLDSEPVQAAAE